jgi:hypothetical protein
MNDRDRSARPSRPEPVLPARRSRRASLHGLLGLAAGELRFGSALREGFSKSILGRSAAAVRNYWQQRTFTGRGVPPAEVSSDADVIRYAREHPGGIGYVSTQTDLAALNVLALR